MATPSLLLDLPAALIPLVYAYLPAHFKLRTCATLSRSLSSRLTPSCFQFDHLHLSPPLLHAILTSPRLAALLSSVSSLSVESDGAVDKALLSLFNRPPQQATAIPHPLSPIPFPGTSLFPSLTFYSQRINGLGFHPSALSLFTCLAQLYVDTRRYDASIGLQFTALFSVLESVKLHALLSSVHLEAIYGLPALTSLDLAGCTVLGGDVALHNMPLVSLLQPPSATACIGRLRTLLCPLGEQRVADIVAIARQGAVLEYLRCDDSPLTNDCIDGLLALPSLTALEVQSHNIRWDHPPFSGLASFTSPPPSASLRGLRFVADHDQQRDRPQLSQSAVLGLMGGLLARFSHLQVMELTLPSTLPLAELVPPLLQMVALRRLSLARTRSGLISAAADPFELASWRAAGIGHSDRPAAFPVLHTLVCRRLHDLSECVLMVMMSQMPALSVLRVMQSPGVGSGGVLACMEFCPLLRSIALIGCSVGMLSLDSWHASQMLVQRVQSAVQPSQLPRLAMPLSSTPPSSDTPTTTATPLLPCLRFVSLQVTPASVDTGILECVLELLAPSPLHYFGFVIHDDRSSAQTQPSTPLLECVALLEHLPSLVGLAAPLAALLIPPRPPTASSSSRAVECSRQWMEGAEARARRERSVMTAERLTAVADSDEQLLFEWMTRHRSLQHEQHAHTFRSRDHRKHYFDRLRRELTRRRLGEMTAAAKMEVEERAVTASQRGASRWSALCCVSSGDEESVFW